MNKKILIVSKFWQEYNHSGMGFCTSKHYEFLLQLGYQVSRISTEIISNPSNSSVEMTYHVAAKGSGSLYSRVSIDKKKLAEAIKVTQPDIIFVEAWQTGISEKAIDIAYSQKIPVVMISHGISILPYNFSLWSIIRSILWLPYALTTLPLTINKLTATTTLSLTASTFRLIDRDIARMFGKKLFHLTNFPVNHHQGSIMSFSSRQHQLLCVGYFSKVKNQIRSLKILKLLHPSFKMIFVGKKEGDYYKKVIKFVKKNELQDRVTFYEDTEIQLSELYRNSFLCLSSSITEVLPLFLLESMASGTPFVATNVGMNKQLGGGFVSNSNRKIARFILSMSSNEILWNKFSNICLVESKNIYSKEIVALQLEDIVNSVLTSKEQ